MPRQRKYQIGIIVPVVAACLFYWWNLETVPVSGRKRFNCMSDWVVDRAGKAAFEVLVMMLEEEGTKPLPEWDPR